MELDRSEESLFLVSRVLPFLVLCALLVAAAPVSGNKPAQSQSIVFYRTSSDVGEAIWQELKLLPLLGLRILADERDTASLTDRIDSGFSTFVLTDPGGFATLRRNGTLARHSLTLLNGRLVSLPVYVFARDPDAMTDPITAGFYAHKRYGLDSNTAQDMLARFAPDLALQLPSDPIPLEIEAATVGQRYAEIDADDLDVVIIYDEEPSVYLAEFICAYRAARDMSCDISDLTAGFDWKQWTDPRPLVSDPSVTGPDPVELPASFFGLVVEYEAHNFYGEIPSRPDDAALPTIQRRERLVATCGTASRESAVASVSALSGKSATEIGFSSAEVRRTGLVATFGFLGGDSTQEEAAVEWTISDEGKFFPLILSNRQPDKAMIGAYTTRQFLGALYLLSLQHVPGLFEDDEDQACTDLARRMIDDIGRVYLLNALLSDPESRHNALSHFGHFFVTSEDEHLTADRRALLESRLRAHDLREPGEFRPTIDWLSGPDIAVRGNFAKTACRPYEEARNLIDRAFHPGRDPRQALNSAQESLFNALVGRSRPSDVAGCRSTYSAFDYRPYYQLSRVHSYLRMLEGGP